MTIDITPEAVERLACILEGRGGFVKDATVVATLRALSAALERSQAETAAAYEAAAAMIETHVVETQFDGSRVVVPNPLAKEDQHHRSLAKAIRALTPADSKAALDRMIEDAEERGMLEAAALCGWDEKSKTAILAAIPKGKDHD